MAFSHFSIGERERTAEAYMRMSESGNDARQNQQNQQNKNDKNRGLLGSIDSTVGAVAMPAVAGGMLGATGGALGAAQSSLGAGLAAAGGIDAVKNLAQGNLKDAAKSGKAMLSGVGNMGAGALNIANTATQTTGAVAQGVTQGVVQAPGEILKGAANTVLPKGAAATVGKGVDYVNDKLKTVVDYTIKPVNAVTDGMGKGINKVTNFITGA